jgi:hypothetical protein
MIDEWTVIKRGLKGQNELLPVPRKKSDQPPPTAWTDIWRECDEVCGEVCRVHIVFAPTQTA